ncbi:MAG: 16S rRNA (adenine(1518)-N(6)/adenine(1519)-N(6))-dimethyltransferase RsmA [Neisseriaceae bacterium]|nr:16S rRNA (adenine(1518)-N(6)/adenine(1519)-N(6))-dimethyltransferase RsmA [Neisseriaceae bacterium]
MQHTARKRFGQNFLQDTGVIRSIIAAINPQDDDIVVEIGPGLGALTQPLSGCLKHLSVIELDRDIIEYLKNQPFADKLSIYSGDVLKFDFAQICGIKKIVGNLPYNISTPLLFHLAQYANEISEMHFMLQKEVVERLCAEPNSKHYGRLSVALQYFFAMEQIITVPPTAFEPAPKVDSAVVRMVSQVGRIGTAVDFAHFSRLVTQSFAMRRKTIRNNLKGLADDDDLLSQGIDPASRAENIAPEQFVGLSNYLVGK